MNRDEVNRLLRVYGALCFVFGIVVGILMCVLFHYTTIAPGAWG